MSLSEVLSTCRSKYTPGERTSWLTTTRSVPLMMKVPLADMSGKSPMNTVWLLISPVVLLMNSAVTNIGAENVMSLSLHSSEEYLGGSKRWSRNDRDIVPEALRDAANRGPSELVAVAIRARTPSPRGKKTPCQMRRRYRGR